jgi:predicted Fe-Mo cluster-binding NifX family protein
VLKLNEGIMKKIAVALMNETEVSRHFGRSRYFGIYTVSEGGVDGPEMRMNTFTHHAQGGHERRHDHLGNGQGHGEHDHSHYSVVDGLNDCKVIIAGGMGMGAVNSLSSAGMEVIITDEDNPEVAVKKYWEGTLKNLNTSCNK